MRSPDWLDDVGKAFFKKHIKTLKDRINENNVETFAVLCEIYSLMRQTTDPKQKKNFIDAYIRLATQFGMTPRSDKLTPKQEVETSYFD